MAIQRIFLITLLVGIVSACSFIDPYSESFYDREAKSILPSEDPLVLALFERRLNRNDIAYKRDYQGFYSAVDPEESGRLISLGKKVRTQTVARESIEVGQDCASRRLQGYLREEDALFVFVKNEDKFNLLVRTEDYAQAQVEERLAHFQAECAAEIEGQ